MTAPVKVDPAQHATQRRMENLLAMSSRLCDAIAADIEALEQGEFGKLTSTDPEIGRLCALYGREVMALKNEGGIKNAPAQLVAALKESGGRLNKLLGQHESLVACMRQASEGLIKVVAEEVERTRTRGAPYTPVPKPKGQSSSGAIVYNKVV
jgi:hypothetical protein